MCGSSCFLLPNRVLGTGIFEALWVLVFLSHSLFDFHSTVSTDALLLNCKEKLFTSTGDVRSQWMFLPKASDVPSET